MTSFKLATAAALALAVIFPGHAQAEKVRIATEGAYKPWNFKDAAGNLIGFELDLAADLCSRAKLDCEIVEQAWKGIIPQLEAGKFDAIMAGMSITEKREKVITFSRNYAATPVRMVVKETSDLASFTAPLDAITLGDVSDAETAALEVMKAALKGKTVGVQTATTFEEFLKAFMADEVEVKTYDTQENLDLDLKAGRVDVALNSMSYWYPLLQSDKGKGLKAVGPAMTGGPFGRGTGVGVRKEDQALADRFSKAIDGALADGTIQRLAVKWFGFDNSPK